MKVYRKRMEQIGKGEVVAGDVRGWWRITDIDINSGGSVVMTGINTAIRTRVLSGSGQTSRTPSTTVFSTD